jgi:hypothetical protein
MTDTGFKIDIYIPLNGYKNGTRSEDFCLRYAEVHAQEVK